MNEDNPSLDTENMGKAAPEDPKSMCNLTRLKRPCLFALRTAVAAKRVAPMIASKKVRQFQRKLVSLINIE